MWLVLFSYGQLVYGRFSVGGEGFERGKSHLNLDQQPIPHNQYIKPAMQRCSNKLIHFEQKVDFAFCLLYIIYSTAKETQKLVTFKLFEYLIISIPEFWFTYEVNSYVMNIL